MEDAKKATKLTEVETLRFQNVSLRLSMVTKERDDLARALFAKYGTDGERITLAEDGSILRAPTPLVAVPQEENA